MSDFNETNITQNLLPKKSSKKETLDKDLDDYIFKDENIKVISER